LLRLWTPTILEQISHIVTTTLKKSEPEALALILRLAQFEENLAEAYSRLDPSVMVKYLMKLSNDTSKAIKVLNIKNESDPDTAKVRLALFTLSQKILAYGMNILGLKPLNKM
jgi:arginyl-tRNA synthetase